MARILFINSVCYGSTGEICKNLYKMAVAQGHECCIAYGRGEAPQDFFCKRIGSGLDVYMHAIVSRMIDRSGYGSVKATRKFVRWLEEYKPDVIHMHNLHGYYLNLNIFFQYLKKHPEIKKIWTLHDCWAYTGHCAYYLYANCYQWKDKCENCVQRKSYPSTFISNASLNFDNKKRLFLGVDNLTLIPVSEWLRNQVKQSFLSCYNTEVITSGIDVKMFKYRESKFKVINGLLDRKIILGVASVWDERKGLDDFIELSKSLTEEYVIVLVGLNKKQIKQLPANVIGIERTENQEQLAELYSMADVFFNPTKEETFGLTNVEAQACGTTVVSYEAGGTVETLVNENVYTVSNLREFKTIMREINCNKAKNNKAVQVFNKEIRMVHYLKYYCEKEW